MIRERRRFVVPFSTLNPYLNWVSPPPLARSVDALTFHLIIRKRRRFVVPFSTFNPFFSYVLFLSSFSFFFFGRRFFFFFFFFFGGGGGDRPHCPLATRRIQYNSILYTLIPIPCSFVILYHFCNFNWYVTFSRKWLRTCHAKRHHKIHNISRISLHVYISCTL